MSPTLDVWWDGVVVGQLSQDRHGELGFVYARDWLQREDAPALSASLPKRPEPYSRRECRPFFGGLLPEEGQRQAVARALGVSRGNDFALLDKLGGDVAGALQLLPPGEQPRPADSDHPPRLLDEAGLMDLLSILYDEDGPRLAPLYDLLATVAYPELSPGMAMKVGRRSTLARWTGGHGPRSPRTRPSGSR